MPFPCPFTSWHHPFLSLHYSIPQNLTPSVSFPYSTTPSVSFSCSPTLSLLVPSIQYHSLTPSPLPSVSPLQYPSLTVIPSLTPSIFLSLPASFFLPFSILLSYSVSFSYLLYSSLLPSILLTVSPLPSPPASLPLPFTSPPLTASPQIRVFDVKFDVLLRQLHQVERRLVGVRHLERGWRRETEDTVQVGDSEGLI